jgi:proteasome lid subunit RPN8/RPN11
MPTIKFNLECNQDLMQQIENICFSDRQNEVGGFLLGNIASGKTVVSHVIAAKHTQATSTQLTFTPETWNDLYDQTRQIEPAVKLIGWFHSHPNHGVFLSEHDKFIQKNFFKDDGQITIVVDPIRGMRGWFFTSQGAIMKYGRESETTRSRLGVSATNSDANVGTVMGIKERSKGNSRGAIILAVIFSLISFGAGVGFTTITHRNEAVVIQQLCETVQNLQIQLAVVAPAGSVRNQVSCSSRTKVEASKSVKPRGSQKATTSKNLAGSNSASTAAKGKN